MTVLSFADMGKVQGWTKESTACWVRISLFQDLVIERECEQGEKDGSEVYFVIINNDVVVDDNGVF